MKRAAAGVIIRRSVCVRNPSIGGPLAATAATDLIRWPLFTFVHLLPAAPCVVPSVEFGVVTNVSTGALVEHGENLTLLCNALYEPAHGLSTFSCNNGTWNVIPRCEPGNNFHSSSSHQVQANKSATNKRRANQLDADEDNDRGNDDGLGLDDPARDFESN